MSSFKMMMHIRLSNDIFKMTPPGASGAMDFEYWSTYGKLKYSYDFLQNDECMIGCTKNPIRFERSFLKYS